MQQVQVLVQVQYKYKYLYKYKYNMYENKYNTFVLCIVLFGEINSSNGKTEMSGKEMGDPSEWHLGPQYYESILTLLE